MTAQEKAKAGLWLLKQAVLEYLAARPEGAPGVEVREALGLEDSDLKGDHKGLVLWGLQNLLAHEGKVEVKTVDRHSRLFLLGQSGRSE